MEVYNSAYTAKELDRAISGGGGGGWNSWKLLYDETLTEPVATVTVSLPEEYTEIFVKVSADFSHKPIIDADGNGYDTIKASAGLNSAYGFKTQPLFIDVTLTQWSGAWGWIRYNPTNKPTTQGGAAIPDAVATPWVGFGGQVGSSSAVEVNAMHKLATIADYKALEVTFQPQTDYLFNTGLRFQVWYK
jgi:hypothetical protein